MADITLYARVTRDELGLGRLDLNDGTNYVVAGRQIDPGQITWTKQEATSPFVHGAVIAHATKALATATLNLRIHGTSSADLATNLSTAEEAFSQEDYDLVIGLDGHYYTYDCGPADWASGFATELANELILPMRLQIPVQPTYTTSATP